MLPELLKEAQNANHDALLELIEQFNPLLKKYARLLRHEDAYNDLVIFFVENVLKIDIASLRTCNDAVIVTYLSKSIYTYYIKIGKRYAFEKTVIALSQLEEWQLSQYEKRISDNSCLPFSSLLYYTDIERVLTKQEYLITRLIFELGYSEAEIAQFYDKTRQAVSQTKRRALKKLRKYYLDNGYECSAEK